MRRVILPLTLLLVTFVGSSSAFGWLNTGHRIIADIVWADLTPPARAWAVDILKQHPRYQEDLLLNKPDGLDDAGAGRYAFVTAATWPDMVRNPTNPLHAKFNHPTWHYIDIPYILNDQTPTTRPAGNPPPKGPQDIIEALTKNVADLKDPTTSPAARAVALCWVLHLCGDIHQPLHACDLFSQQFPTGDLGGNLFIVLRDPPYPDSKNNLHFVWDSLPGDFQSRDQEEYIATGLQADPRYSRALLKNLLADKDFMSWARESHDLAVKYVYVNGDLRGVAKGAPLAPHTPIPGLPPDYLRNAENVADQRLILAGYRTADLLNAIFTASAQSAGAK